MWYWMAISTLKSMLVPSGTFNCVIYAEQERTAGINKRGSEGAFVCAAELA
jgi:hypothetical protein